MLYYIMKIDKTCIILTDPFVVNFLNLNKGNESLIKACDDLLNTFCKSAQNFMESHDKTEKSKREINTLMSFLEDFEKRQIENEKQQLLRQQDTEKMFEQKFNKLSEQVNDKISGQIMTMITSVDKTISGTLNDNVRKMIEKEIKENNKDLENNIRTQLTTYIKSPLDKVVEQYGGNMDKILGSVKDLESKMNLEKVILSVKDLESKINVDKVIGSVKEIETKVNGVLQTSLSKWYETKTLNESQKQYLSEQINNIPIISKGIFSDVIRNLEDKHHKVDLLLHATNQQLNKINTEVRENYSSLAVIKSNTEQLIAKSTLEQYSNSFKGTEGQNTVFDMLSEKLLVKDGYELKQIHGVSHSTDTIIHRLNYPPVRIEIKNHGKNTGEKVRTSHVEKFRRDLMECESSGILVSLHSAIVGRSDFLELEQLPNGKFAIYLPNNEYNMQIIIDMLHLIYRLESVMKNDDDSSSHLQISKENLIKMENYLNDFALKISSVKNQMKQSLIILNEITVDVITNIIINQKKENLEKIKFKCEKCALELKSKSGYTNHVKNCKAETLLNKEINDENISNTSQFVKLKKNNSKSEKKDDKHST